MEGLIVSPKRGRFLNGGTKMRAAPFFGFCLVAIFKTFSDRKWDRHNYHKMGINNPRTKSNGSCRYRLQTCQMLPNYC
jgi:hypothetical protein